jgi:hypothetical protein
MNNPPAVKIGIIISFIQIAIQVLFLYIIMNNSFLNTYLGPPFSIFSFVAYLITIYFLRSTLVYFNEKQSIVNAFSIYLGLNIVLFLVNTAVSYLIRTIIYFPISLRYIM